MLASLTEPHIWTANLLVIGLVQGLVVSLIAMGIVLVYRSSRVINFAVGDLGVPAAAVLAVMVGKNGWPYWPGLLFAVAIGTLTGTVVEVAVIRRLVEGATRHRAGRDDRHRRAVPGGGARDPRLPHRTAADLVPEPDDVDVDDLELRVRPVPRARHHDHRPAAAGDDRRAVHHRRTVVAARSHALRRRGARGRDQRRPRATHRREPEARVDRDLDDRRVPVDRLGDSLRNAADARPNWCRSVPRRCYSVCRPRSSDG